MASWPWGCFALVQLFFGSNQNTKSGFFCVEACKAWKGGFFMFFFSLWYAHAAAHLTRKKSKPMPAEEDNYFA